MLSCLQTNLPAHKLNYKTHLRAAQNSHLLMYAPVIVVSYEEKNYHLMLSNKMILLNRQCLIKQLYKQILHMIPNGHNSEWTPSRMHMILNGHHPECYRWNPFRTDTIPNGHHSKWMQCRMDTILHGHHPKWI